MCGMAHGGSPQNVMKWHTSDVECDSILSRDCSDGEDSSKRSMRLSIKDK